MELLSPIFFYLPGKIDLRNWNVSFCDIIFQDHRREWCKRPEVQEHEEKLEESSVSGYLRFSMGRRQDDSKEETWKTKHWYIPELYGHELKIQKITPVLRRHGQGKEQW